MRPKGLVLNAVRVQNYPFRSKLLGGKKHLAAAASTDVQSIATGIECGRDCKTSPYKLCTALSINLYPRKIGNTDPVRETRLWYNLIGEVVQSLYGLLFEQTSPSIPVAIDCTPEIKFWMKFRMKSGMTGFETFAFFAWFFQYLDIQFQAHAEK